MKLNLGSGSNYLQGYVNVDPQTNKKADVRTEAYDYLKDLDTGSVEEILCEHLLEHIPPVDGFLLIKECFRVLKVKGVLIIESPDLDKLGRVYGTGKLHYEHFRQGIFGEKGGVSVGEGHVWSYKEDEMTAILRDVGFMECGASINPEEYRWKFELSFRLKAIK